MSIDNQARKILIEVVIDLVKSYNYTREQIEKYIHSDIVNDAFKEIEVNRNYPNNINEVLHQLQSKLSVLASTSRSIHDIGLDNTDNDFKEAVVELIDLIDRLEPKVRITLRLIRTARHRGKFKDE